MHHWLLSTSDFWESESIAVFLDQGRLKEAERTVTGWTAGVEHIAGKAVQILAVLLKTVEREVVGSIALELARKKQLGKEERVPGRSGR